MWAIIVFFAVSITVFEGLSCSEKICQAYLHIISFSNFQTTLLVPITSSRAVDFFIISAGKGKSKIAEV